MWCVCVCVRERERLYLATTLRISSRVLCPQSSVCVCVVLDPGGFAASHGCEQARADSSQAAQSSVCVCVCVCVCVRERETVTVRTSVCVCVYV